VAASLQAPELFVIAQDLRRMQVDVSVDEAEVGRVREGQSATFTVDSFPGRTFQGTVGQVRKAALVVQNVVTYTAVIATSNPSLELFPGMTANVRIVVDTRENALKVPNAALRFRPAGASEPRAPGGDADAGGAQTPGGQAKGAADGQRKRSEAKAGSRAGDGRAATGGRVWVLDDTGKLTSVDLRLGLSDGTHTEVLGGVLQEGSRVVVGTLADKTARAQPKGGPRFGF